MELTYQGGHDAVDVLLPFGGEVTVPHGGSYDFHDEHAERLLEQPENWCLTVPEISLEERIEMIKTHDDANALGVELGLAMEGTTPKRDDKKAAIAAAVDARNAAAAAAAEADANDNDDSAGASGEEQ